MTRDKFNKMGRRRFINTMATLGISGTALQYMTSDTLAALTDNPKEDVPRLKGLRHKNPQAYSEPPLPESPEWVPEYYTIPRDKWVEIETARKAARKVNRLLDRRGVEQVTAGISTLDGRKSIVVKYQIIESCSDCGHHAPASEPNMGFQSVEELLPDRVSAKVTYGNTVARVDDIPVVLERETLEEQMPYCDDMYYYQCSYRPVPGGCGLGGEAGGTMTSPIYDKDTDYYRLLTCGHCISDDRDGDGVVEVDQPAGGTGIGLGHAEKVAHEDYFDAGVVNRDPGIDYKYSLARDAGDNQYRNWIIIGQLGWSTILDNEGNSSYGLELQGATVGLDSGHITWTREYGGDKLFRIDVDSSSGDSGGPHFRREPYDYGTDYDYQLYIAGVHGWGAGTEAQATAMERITERFNVRI